MMSDLAKESKEIKATKKHFLVPFVGRKWTIKLGDESLCIRNHKREPMLSVRAQNARLNITFQSTLSHYNTIFKGASKKVKLLLNEDNLAALTRWIDNATAVLLLRDMQSKQIADFWHTTWLVWRSGALSWISDVLLEVAWGSFDRFLAHCADVQAPGMRIFLNEFSPLPGEFLIGYAGEEKPSFVLTNNRLVIRDSEKDRLEVLQLAEIQSFHLSGWFTTTLRLVRQDGKEMLFRELVHPVREDVLQWTIERARFGGSWGIVAEPSVPAAIEESRSVVLGCEKCGTNEDMCEEYFFYYGKVLDESTTYGVVEETKVTYSLIQSPVCVRICDKCIRGYRKRHILEGPWVQTGDEMAIRLRKETLEAQGYDVFVPRQNKAKA